MLSYRTLLVQIPLCALLSFGAGAATLVVDGLGELLGAEDVSVGGFLYDVEFVDGSCASLFSNCTDFTFTTEADALAASQALLDQVFLDVPAGDFDTDQALTHGCEPQQDEHDCNVITPWGQEDGVGNQLVVVGIASNFPEDVSDNVHPGDRDVNFDTTARLNFVYADWTLVPEPSSALLLGLGLVALARRRTR